MALSAVLAFGERSPLGGGLDPAVVAHLHEGGVPRFLAYEVRGDGTLDRVPGAYVPEFEADPAYPVTDLILATRRELSSVGQRLDVLSTKAEANYGAPFREKVFSSEVEWGTDGYGRHFEARSQLEAHPLDGAVSVAFFPGISDPARSAIADNLARLDCPVLRAD